MAEVWDADLPTDQARVARLIAEQFPSLAGFPPEPFGAGFDNAAYAVGPWIFRFVRRRFALPLLEREIRWLPAIAPHLPVPISAPVFVGRDEAGHPFAGYRRLAGETACRAGLDAAARAALAAPLGTCLRALHACPADGLPGDELRRADPVHRLAFARDRVAAIARHDAALAAAVAQRVEACAAQLTAPADALACVHGDLYPRHVIVDGGRLSGLIDWGDLHRGDPALDLALGAAFLPPAAQADFRTAYGGVDDATWARARFRAVWHTSATLAYGLAIGDEALRREGCIALAHLAGDDTPRV